MQAPMAYRRALIAAAVLLAAPQAARADFFDDARKTLTNDIPHFFQDDIPCTFGGQPTSGTRQSCRRERPPPARSHPAPSHPAPSHPAPARPVPR